MVERDSAESSGEHTDLSNLHINFYYGTGLLEDGIEPLTISTNRDVFDKHVPGVHVSNDHIATLQEQAETCGQTREALVTSLKFSDFVRLYESLVDINVGGESSSQSKEGGDTKGVSGFI